MKLTQTQKEKLAKIAAKFLLKFVVLFGSYAEQKETPVSDLDIAVYLKRQPLSYHEFAELYFSLAEIFPQFEVDLAILNTADPLFRYEITRKGRLLYGDELAYLEYKAFAFKDYIDTANLREAEKASILKRQKLLKKLIYA